MPWPISTLGSHVSNSAESRRPNDNLTRPCASIRKTAWLRIICGNLKMDLSPNPEPSKQPFFDRLGDRAAPRIDVQLGVDIAQVGIDGVVTQRQLVGDFLFDQSLGH